MTAQIIPQIGQSHEPQFDPELRQYVSITLDGGEVYGDTWSECFHRLTGANDVILKAQRNGEDTLIHQAATLSSGTIASVSGLTHYTVIDEVQRRFVGFCEDHPHFARWQDAWTEFAGEEVTQ